MSTDTATSAAALAEPKLRLLGRFNEGLAVRATKAFGSMAAFWLFFAYGVLPIIDPAHQIQYLNWSNWAQLWALPLLAVGAVVIGRNSAKRDAEMYDAVMETRRTVLEEVGLVREDHDAMASLVAELHAHFLADQPTPEPAS